jgi:hypothetical protein
MRFWKGIGAVSDPSPLGYPDYCYACLLGTA